VPTKSEVLAAWHACRAANETFFATFFAAYPRGSIIQWVDRVDGCRVKGRLLGPTIAYTCPGVVHSGPVKVEVECVAVEHWESGTLMSVETVVEHNEPQA